MKFATLAALIAIAAAQDEAEEVEVTPEPVDAGDDCSEEGNG